MQRIEDHMAFRASVSFPHIHACNSHARVDELLMHPTLGFIGSARKRWSVEDPGLGMASLGRWGEEEKRLPTLDG